jgi:hypothetical protein
MVIVDALFLVYLYRAGLKYTLFSSDTDHILRGEDATRPPKTETRQLLTHSPTHSLTPSLHLITSHHITSHHTTPQ